MFISNVGPKHFATQACRTQAAQFVERDRLAKQAIQATNLVFYVGKVPLENVTEYKYLGRPLSSDDSDNAAVSLNISKATRTWFGTMYRILSSDGADSKTMAHFYLAMVQAKLLYGFETWVLSRHLLNCLEQPFSCSITLTQEMYTALHQMTTPCVVAHSSTPARST
jgi:hypothetical protein